MDAELNQWQLLSGLIGGLALFLFGMDILTRALKQVAGGSMKSILARMTRTRLAGLFAGMTLTAIIQSSSVTTVLLVGFVSAGLIGTSQSVAVIMGANIGTTITAQILAFKVSAIALPVLAAGFFVSFIAKRKATREYGRIFLGLGMIFFGMAIMSDAMAPLRSYTPFLSFMHSLDNVLLAALVGAGFTAIIQSSSATTGILIVMLGQGLIGLEPAIALALGANIGTCVTALLASIGRPRAALRVALIHTLFNVLGVALWIGFVPQLAEIAREISNLAGESTAAPRQLANVHTFFNLANAALFIGFTDQFSRFVNWLVPDHPEPEGAHIEATNLDPQFLSVPALAVDAVRREIVHLGELVTDEMKAVMPTVVSGSPLAVEQLKVMDRPVDLLHRAIVDYLRRISVSSLPADQSALLIGLVKIANDLEHIGDLISITMVATARQRIEENVTISPATQAVLAGLHQEVVEALEGVTAALAAQDAGKAEAVRQMKAGFVSLIEQIAGHEINRLQADEPRRLHTYAREMEITETLDDIFKIIRRIARTEMALFSEKHAPPSEQKKPG